MTSKQKTQGDAWERRVLKLFQKAGFDDARRTRAGYERDGGDLHLIRSPLGPKYMIQCKATRDLRWGEWSEDLIQQIEESNADYGFLALKRKLQSGRVQGWIAMPMEDFAQMLAELEGKN